MQFLITGNNAHYTYKLKKKRHCPVYRKKKFAFFPQSRIKVVMK